MKRWVCLSLAMLCLLTGCSTTSAPVVPMETTAPVTAPERPKGTYASAAEAEAITDEELIEIGRNAELRSTDFLPDFTACPAGSFIVLEADAASDVQGAMRQWLENRTDDALVNAGKNVDNGDILYHYRNIDIRNIRTESAYCTFVLTGEKTKEWLDHGEISKKTMELDETYSFPFCLLRQDGGYLYTGEKTADAIMQSLDLLTDGIVLYRTVSETDGQWMYTYVMAETCGGDWGLNATVSLCRKTMLVTADGTVAFGEAEVRKTCEIPDSAPEVE